MTTLITGGLGYIGTAYAYANECTGPVIILDHAHEERYHRQHECMSDLATIVKGDAGSFADVQQIIKDWEVEHVVHLAALTNAAESMEKPQEYRRGNIEVTKALVQACRGQVKSFVFASSAAVYGDSGEKEVSETSDTRPTNVYGETKLKSEQDIREAFEGTDTGFTILRFFNVVGASHDFVTGKVKGPDLMSRILDAAITGKPLRIYGDGSAIRDYVTMENVVKAIDLAQRLAVYESGGVFNVGSGQPLSVTAMVSLAEASLNQAIPVKMSAPRPGEVSGFVANNSRLKEAGWKPFPQNMVEEFLIAYCWERLSRQGNPHLAIRYAEDDAA